MKTGKLWTGTSNIAIPGAKQNFPEEFREKSRLAYHAALFNTLEVNSTFYKLPLAKTLARWSEDVPDEFRFTLKLHQGITHAENLDFDPEDVAKFMHIADAIGPKKACILLQFPSGVTTRLFAQVKEMIGILSQADPDHAWRKAVEFRHTSWYNEDTYRLLAAHRATLVLHDMPRSRITTPGKEAPFIYRRFHGPTGNYKGSYDDAALHQAADEIRQQLNRGLDVYIYFNNTMGEAFYNAQRLRDFIVMPDERG